MNRTATILLIIAAVLIAAALAAVHFFGQPANPFPIVAPDHVESWELQKPQDYATAAPKTKADIAKLEGYVGTSTYAVSDIYIGIANDYLLLGDGKSAYEYYGKALAATSTEPVIYADLGSLMARLYATSTALAAYKQAAALAPNVAFYQLGYIDYLALVSPKGIETQAAFSAAARALGQNPSFFMARAAWEGSIGSTTAAIADWQAAESSASPAQRTAIEAQIARLRAQK